MDKAIQTARLSDQIRDLIATWSRQDMPGPFFTISEVTVDTDKHRAIIWVSSLDHEQLQGIVSKLKKFEGPYQRRLRKAIPRMSLPRISFSMDLRELAAGQSLLS